MSPATARREDPAPGAVEGWNHRRLAGLAIGGSASVLFLVLFWALGGDSEPPGRILDASPAVEALADPSPTAGSAAPERRLFETRHVRVEFRAPEPQEEVWTPPPPPPDPGMDEPY